MANEIITPRTVTVIISTYNNPKWLNKTLYGYLYQTHLPDEIIIADDGSKDETKKVIDDFRSIAPFPVKHVWHKDDGFRKCIILNRATIEVTSEYAIFTDQDCVPREDFVEMHCSKASPKHYLSGGMVRLDMELSESMTIDEIKSRKIFDIKYLRTKGYKKSFKSRKLTRNECLASFMNYITTTKASWNGSNASGWLVDILAVNGHDNTMSYGGEDREFGERLQNMGIRGKQIRYSAICLHLDHGRPYKNSELIRKNKALRRKTRKMKVISTPDGIKELCKYE